MFHGEPINLKLEGGRVDSTGFACCNSIKSEIRIRGKEFGFHCSNPYIHSISITNLGEEIQAREVSTISLQYETNQVFLSVQAYSCDGS